MSGSKLGKCLLKRTGAAEGASAKVFGVKGPPGKKLTAVKPRTFRWKVSGKGEWEQAD